MDRDSTLSVVDASEVPLWSSDSTKFLPTCDLSSRGFLVESPPPLNLQPLHPLTLRWMYAGVFCSVRAPLPPLMRNRLRLTRLYTMVRLTFYLRLCTALVMSPRDKLLRRLL